MSSHGYSLDRQNNRPNQIHPPVMLSQRGLAGHGDRLSPSIKLSTRDIASGRHRVPLSRFLTDSIPAVHARVWTRPPGFGSGNSVRREPPIVERKAKERSTVDATIYWAGRRTGLAGGPICSLDYFDGLFMICGSLRMNRRSTSLF